MKTGDIVYYYPPQSEAPDMAINGTPPPYAAMIVNVISENKFNLLVFVDSPEPQWKVDVDRLPDEQPTLLSGGWTYR